MMEALKGQLLVYARVRIGPNDVEDVVAETFVKFLRQIRSDARISNAVSLLFTILRNLITDRHRRKELVESVSDHELLSQQAARLAPVAGAEDEVISRTETNRILAQVPQSERVVLYLRHVQDLSVEEVATRTGLSVDQVKKRTAEGIRHLKEVLHR
jgi:RNA polymerase sigma-70 factor (ECF subfamily)